MIPQKNQLGVHAIASHAAAVKTEKRIESSKILPSNRGWTGRIQGDPVKQCGSGLVVSDGSSFDDARDQRTG